MSVFSNPFYGFGFLFSDTSSPLWFSGCSFRNSPMVISCSMLCFREIDFWLYVLGILLCY